MKVKKSYEFFRESFISAAFNPFQSWRCGKSGSGRWLLAWVFLYLRARMRQRGKFNSSLWKWVHNENAQRLLQYTYVGLVSWWVISSTSSSPKIISIDYSLVDFSNCTELEDSNYIPSPDYYDSMHWHTNKIMNGSARKHAPQNDHEARELFILWN